MNTAHPVGTSGEVRCTFGFGQDFDWGVWWVLNYGWDRKPQSGVY